MYLCTQYSHRWEALIVYAYEYATKNCEWIIGGDFNMTEQPGDKFHAVLNIEAFI